MLVNDSFYTIIKTAFYKKKLLSLVLFNHLFTHQIFEMP